MADNVSALLKQLSSASQSLTEASNILTEQIKEIEKALASYNLGVQVSTVLRHLSTEVDIGTHVVSCDQVDSFGYFKHNGKWGLFVTTYTDGLDDEKTWPLHDAPRELRILAVDSIPALLEKMVAGATTLAAEVTTKAEFAKSLANSLRQSPRKAGA
jgi:hypothetical protein